MSHPVLFLEASEELDVLLLAGPAYHILAFCPLITYKHGMQGPSPGSRNRTQREGHPGVYYTVVIRQMANLECQYDISHFFNHGEG